MEGGHGGGMEGAWRESEACHLRSGHPPLLTPVHKRTHSQTTSFLLIPLRASPTSLNGCEANEIEHKAQFVQQQGFALGLDVNQMQWPKLQTAASGRSPHAADTFLHADTLDNDTNHTRQVFDMDVRRTRGTHLLSAACTGNLNECQTAQYTVQELTWRKNSSSNW